MAIATKLRAFARLLDASEAPFWVIDPQGTLVFLSAGVANWVGQDVDAMLGRRCVAGTSVSADPLDQLAASLSPPPGFQSRGTASLRIQPAVAGSKPAAMETRFTRLGSGDHAFTIAVAGEFDDRTADPELEDAVAIRQRLDAWRSRHAAMTTIATAGTSSLARRLRRRLQVAAAIRTDIGFFGPGGCAGEAIAMRIAQLSAPNEPLVVIDGSLMDPELLDASLAPLDGHLADSNSALATAVIRSLDEMPTDAQNRLVQRHSDFGGRLRLLAIARSDSCAVSESTDQIPLAKMLDPVGEHSAQHRGIIPAMAEVLGTLAVSIPPLVDRVEDIPMLATALLAARRAAGETQAERLSRPTIDALVIYPWPHDFQELEQAIHHAARTASGQSVAPEYLPLAIRSYRPGTQPRVHATSARSLDDAVRNYELKLIRKAIEAAGGNRAEAARRLDISRARLLRRLNEADSASDDELAPVNVKPKKNRP